MKKKWVCGLLILLLVPAGLYSTAKNSAEDFMRKTNRTSTDLAYRNWNWRWNGIGSSIDIFFVDKSDVLTDEFGKFRNGVIWRFNGNDCQFVRATP